MKDPKPDELLAGEKVGLLRSLAIVKNELDDPTLELFQTRLEEGYDLEGEDDDRGRLWRIFRNINKCLSMQKRPNDEDGLNDEQLSAPNDDEDKDDSAVPETESENEEDVSHVTDGNSTATRTKPSAPLTTTPSRPSTSAFSSGVLVNPSAHSSPVPRAHQTLNNESRTNISFHNSSPSRALNTSSTSYTNFPYSPFKSFLQISDHVHVSKKKPATNKSKVLHAISGTAFNEKARQKQEEKVREEEAKKRRKEERLLKKQLTDEKRKQRKSKGMGKKIIREIDSESSSENEAETIIDYDDDSDTSILMEEINSSGRCLACEGRDRWNDNRAWIGCNQCSGWLHRSCVSSEVENLSERQIERFEFVCFACEKSKR